MSKSKGGGERDEREKNLEGGAEASEGNGGVWQVCSTERKEGRDSCFNSIV